MTLSEKEILLAREAFLERGKQKSDKRILERAGLVGESNNRTGSRVGSGMLVRPGWAEIEGRCIHWGGDERRGAHPFRWIEPDPEVFDRFIGLWKRGDIEIVRFARKWGTLRRPLRLLQKPLKSDDEAREPLAKWRTLSLHAYELRQIAATLRTGEKMTFDYWFTLISAKRALTEDGQQCWRTKEEYLYDCEMAKKMSGPPPDYSLVDPDLWRGIAENYLHYELQGWNAKFGPVGIEFDHKGLDAGSPAMPWGVNLDFGGSLLCYIGYQLGLVVMGGEVFICSACGQPYLRERGRRLPNPGARNYCDDEKCRVRERNRIAAVRARRKKKATQRSALKVRTPAQ